MRTPFGLIAKACLAGLLVQIVLGLLLAGQELAPTGVLFWSLLGMFVPVVFAAMMGFHEGREEAAARRSISPLHFPAASGDGHPLTVAVTLRRTTVERATVCVPVAARHLASGRLDTERLAQDAVSLGQQATVDWKREGPSVVELDPHQQEAEPNLPQPPSRSPPNDSGSPAAD